MFIIQEIFGYCLISFICLLALAILYAPIAYLLRRHVSPTKQSGLFLFGTCVIIVLSATVFLSISQSAPADRSLNLIPFRALQETWQMPGPKQLAQTVANVVMFIPLGFTLPLAFRNMRSFWKTSLTLALFSLAIEATQYFIGRSADIDDLLLNTLGGMLGCLLFFLLAKRFGKKTPVKPDGNPDVLKNIHRKNQF